MGLELYAIVEEHLDFKEEVARLHNKFLELAIQENPQKVLDAGCGQGGFLELLNDKNIQNLGIDLSQNQIKIAKEKGLNAICDDIKNLDEKFDLVTAIFDVINYIPPENIEDFFQNIFDILENGGKFIFDVNSKFAFEEIVEGSIVIDKDDKFITIDANFKNPILTTEIILFTRLQNGLFEKSNDSILQYFHTKDFILKTAKKCGFTAPKTKNFNLHGFSQEDKIIFTFSK